MQRSHSLSFLVGATALTALLTLCSVAPLGAQDRTPPPSARPTQDASRRPHGPPPEALEACRSHAAGAACGFTGPRGERVDGRCGGPDGMPLACMPPPPPEALAACEDIAEGDDCVVETPHGTIEGTCRRLREGPSACVPHGPPPPHPPPPSTRTAGGGPV